MLRFAIPLLLCAAFPGSAGAQGRPLADAIRALRGSGPFDAAMRVLVATGAKAVPPVVGLLEDPSHNVRRRAAEVLSRIGATAVDDLAGVLRKGSPHARRAAALALRKIGDSAVRRLIEVIEDGDALAARWAAWAMRPKGKAAIAPLVTALFSQSRKARQVAERSLASLGARAVPRLQELLKSGRMHVRRSAADVLAIIGPPALPAADALCDQLCDRNGIVAQACVRALSRIGVAVVPRLVRKSREFSEYDKRWWRLQSALVRIGKPALGVLRGYTDLPAGRRRSWIRETIGQIEAAVSRSGK